MIGSLKIVFDGNIYNTKVYLNNEMISGMVQEIDINVPARRLPEATLRILIHDIELDFEECEIKFNGHAVVQQLAYQVYQDLKKFFEQEIPPGFLGLKDD